MSNYEIIKEIESAQLRQEALAPFNTGDTIKVYNKTFTVRKTSNGVGVEKTWPIHSPFVEKIEVVRQGKVRRAKLNYLRDRVGKAAKVKAAK